MRILFVNHTFPPESYAGSELCVLNLAHELQRRGHQTAAFYRYADPTEEEYRIRSGSFESIPIYKINHTFRFIDTFQSIYVNSAIAAKFSHLLYEFKPDVVHFHHLTNLSLSLAHEAKMYGAAAIMTLHDYWLLCQRGQLLKQDLSLCAGPSEEDCRSCLAIQLLRGTAQRYAAGLFKRSVKRSRPEEKVYDLMDLRKVERKTPDPNFISQAVFDLGGDSVPALLTHPPAELTYPIQLNRPARLRSAAAMHPSTFDCEGDGVRFEVLRNQSVLFSRTVNAKRNHADQRWFPFDIALDPSDREDDCLILRVHAENPENNQFCSAGWREPSIVYIDGPDFPRKLESPRKRQLRSLIYQTAHLAAGAAAAFSPKAREGIRHRRNWINRIINEMDQFISPSRFLMEFFLRHGMPEEKIVFSDNGFIRPEIEPKAPIGSPIRFGYIGTWIPSKGVDIALQAFEKIDPAKAKLTVHGFFPGFDGYEDYETQLRAMAGPAVEFNGRYDPKDVYSLLAEMDCLIVPSIWWENSPLTTHEAFLAHVPLIVADVGGMAEQVKQGGGLLFRHRDSTSLRMVIKTIIQEPTILDNLRAEIPDIKSVRRHADELIEIYTNALKKKEE